MILDEIRAIQASSTDLRKFGFLLGGILLLAGGGATWKGRIWGYPMLGVSFLLLALALVAPSALRGFHRAWMAVSAVLGAVMSTLILALLFYLVITPIGVAMRLFSRDPMCRRYGPPDLSSYWIPRKPSAGDRDFEKQF